MRVLDFNKEEKNISIKQNKKVNHCPIFSLFVEKSLNRIYEDEE
jgi:hypothetical protein